MSPLTNHMQKLLLLTAYWLLPLVMTAQYSSSIRSGRPGQAAGPFTVGQNALQYQTGINYNRLDGNQNSWQTISHNHVLRVGIKERLEGSAMLNWQQDANRHTDGLATSSTGGISQIQFGGRGLLSIQKGLLPTICMQARVIVPSPSEAYRTDGLGATVLVDTQHTLNNTLGITSNWQVSWVDRTAAPIYTGILNLSINLGQRWGSFLETYTSLNSVRLNYDAGFSYLLTPDFQLDASAGWQSAREIRDWFLDFGVSWRLDWR